MSETEVAPPPTLYDTMGVPRNADAGTIKSAWKAGMRRLHPDFNGNTEASQIYHDFYAAHQTLSNPELRAQYDKTLTPTPTYTKPTTTETSQSTRATNPSPYPRYSQPTMDWASWYSRGEVGESKHNIMSYDPMTMAFFKALTAPEKIDQNLDYDRLLTLFILMVLLNQSTLQSQKHQSVQI